MFLNQNKKEDYQIGEPIKKINFVRNDDPVQNRSTILHSYLGHFLQ